MAWESLSTRKGIDDKVGIEGLPLVLAGPIVRKVTNKSVSVWIAIKQADPNIELKIFEDDAEKILKSRGPGSTIQLGQYLYVALITIELEDTNELKSDILYYYNIYFKSGAKSLTSPKVLGKNSDAIKKITYNSYGLPSFRLPSSILNDLIIAHGSCRKPTGGSDGDPDSFSIIDKLSINTPLNRPQLLLLTGDQIYADDVSGILLFLLNDTAKLLLGHSEDIIIPPGYNSNRLSNILNSYIIGGRQDLMLDIGFTSGEAAHHLILLEEFFCMYLFVWSDVLWPKELPAFKDITGLEEKIEYFEDRGDKGWKKVEKYQDNVITYHDEIKLLNIFKSGLGAVRRILANTITYMIHDDHEVTDDLFFRKYWCDKTLKENTLSRQVIRNGLTAYAIFQGWGNNPDNIIFKDADNKKNILNCVQTLDIVNLDKLILPVIKETASKEGGKPEKEYFLAEGPIWHYTIEYDLFNLIFLDIRTRRGFPSQKGAAALINIFGQGMYNQLPDMPGKEFAIIVSPAPVMGKPFVEKGLQEKSEAIGAVEMTDNESWGLNNYALQNFLNRVLKYKKIVLLSGDVHYAFSNKTEYWSKRWLDVHGNREDRRMILVQLCSSPFKKKDWLSKIPGYIFIDREISVSEPKVKWLPLSRTMKGIVYTATIVTAFLELIRKNNHSFEFIGWRNKGLHLSSKTGLNGSYIKDEIIQANGVVATGTLKSKFHRLDNDYDWFYKTTFAEDSVPKGSFYSTQQIVATNHNVGFITFDAR